MPSQGKITVLTGPMFAGKTERLISFLKKEKYRHRDLLYLKSSVDTRYSEKEIVSHDGLKLLSTPISNAIEFKEVIAETNKSNLSVAIDEAQFLTDEIIEPVWESALDGIRFYIAGLDRDSFGRPFGSMPSFMAYADRVIKLHAQCTVCGKNASLTYRVQKSEEQIKLGGVKDFEARCKTHWRE